MQVAKDCPPHLSSHPFWRHDRLVSRQGLQKQDMCGTLPRLFWQMTVCSSMNSFFPADDNLFIYALFPDSPLNLVYDFARSDAKG
jgi:hypothetical protein